MDPRKEGRVHDDNDDKWTVAPTTRHRREVTMELVEETDNWRPRR